MENEIKNPMELIEKAEMKYLEEWKEFSEKYHKLYDYIKPFIEQNEEYKGIVESLNLHLVAMPLAHIIIIQLHITNLKLMRSTLIASIPPLKIECPDCKKVLWDMTEMRKFFDPDGKFYGEKNEH